MCACLIKCATLHKISCTGVHVVATVDAPKIASRSSRKSGLRSQAGPGESTERSRESTRSSILTRCFFKIGNYVLLWMDELLHHTRNPWNDDSPVNTNKQWFQPWPLKWCEMDWATIHSRDLCPMTLVFQGPADRKTRVLLDFDLGS